MRRNGQVQLAGGWAQRPELVVMAGRFLTSTGYFLVVPFITIYLIGSLRMSPAQAGTLFAVLTVTRRGLGWPAGWFSTRFGARRSLVAGLLIESLAYLCFDLAHSFLPWLLAVTLLGGGGSLNNMGTRAILAMARNQSRAVNFSRYYALINVAALIGPMIGAVMIARHLTALTFLAAGSLHLALGLYSLAVIPESAGADRAPGRPQLRNAFRDRAILLYSGLTIASWFSGTQYYVALPLTISHQRIPAAVLGPLNAANALAVIVALWFLGRRIERMTNLLRLRLFALSVAVQGAGWLACIVPGLLPIGVMLLVVSLGEALFMAVVDVLAAELAPPGYTAIYLSFTSMAWAVGGVMGGSAGALFSIASRHADLPLFWLALALPGIVCALIAGALAPRLATVMRGRRLEPVMESQ